MPYYNFFSGAGLVEIGLSPAWTCRWAIDWDEKKTRLYRAWFGDDGLHEGDVAAVRAADLPPGAVLSWASFPCQDLSLAGAQRGLTAPRSGAFWPFWKLMHDLHREGRRPPIVVLENVAGLLAGDAFAGAAEALAALQMSFGALLVDARHFLPQSRPRVFLLAADDRLDVASLADPDWRSKPWFPPRLQRAREELPAALAARWIWWRLPPPPPPDTTLAAIVDRDDPPDARLHSAEQTARLLSLMDDNHRRKCEAARERARRGGERVIGMLYKRTRAGRQRAEVRFDGCAGCLRTPAGGSSRQTVLIVRPDRTLSRLLSPREAARLMGVPDAFPLPAVHNDAYFAMGDAVAAPAVAHLARHLLDPLAAACRAQAAALEGRPRLDRALVEKLLAKAQRWAAGRKP